MTIRLGTIGQFCLSFFISGILTLLRVNPWVAMLTAIVLTLSIDTALAQTTCTTVGDTTYCSNGQTCTRVGNTVYCN